MSAAAEPPRHARIIPSSLEKMKFAGASAGLAVVATTKLSGMPAKTAPVGPPSTPTTSGLIPPALVYRVDRSVPLSATHHGLVALRASPQPLTRFGSVAAAAPGTSETSRVTAYVPPGGAAGSCAAATSANEATVAKNVMRRIVPRMTHSSSCRVPASPYDEMHGPVHIRCNTSLQPGEGAGPRGCVAAKARRRRSRRWRASSRHHRAGAAEEPHGEHAIDGRETPDATRPWRS